MLTLTITFPGKQYHATPWGAHVNEGHVEWPPSPWRICRALLATGIHHHGWSPEALPPLAIELLESLSRTLPRYRLPPSLTVAHTRHYMPEGTGKTTKVFDTFARFSDRPAENTLAVGWDITLSPAAFMALAALAARLSYLGRAESWAQAHVNPCALEDANCYPLDGPVLPQNSEVVTLLAPATPEDFAAWREARLGAKAGKKTGKEASKTTKKPKKPKKGAPVIPEDLAACLLQATDALRAQGWSAPPGSREVLYTRPADALVAAQAIQRSPKPAPRRVECALIALSSYAVNREVLPQLRFTLPQTEVLHRALASRLHGRSNPELLGLDDTGEPLRGHRHAHYIPLSLGERRDPGQRRSDAAIDHILVYAPGGLDDQALRAIERLSWIRRAKRLGNDREANEAGEANEATEAADEAVSTDRKDRDRLATTLISNGNLRHLLPAIRDRGGADLFGESRVWTSYTPFVASRFLKRNRAIDDQLVAELARELASRGLPELDSLELLDREAVVGAGFLTFARRRQRGRPQPPSTQPLALRLTFKAALRGPLTLGYGAHFGLGLFCVADQNQGHQGHQGQVESPTDEGSDESPAV